MEEHLNNNMLSNKSYFWSKLLNTSNFIYLRKCAAIKKELQLMGHPDLKVVIRNIPAKSDRYYLCYENICIVAAAYDVIRNNKQEIVQIVNSKEAGFAKEVEEYIDGLIDKEDILYNQPTAVEYPLASPSNIEIYIYEEEKLDFIPTKAYARILQKCTASLADIKQRTNMSLKREDVKHWLIKNKNLYWSLQLYWNYYNIGRFQLIYLLMDQWEQLFQMGSVAKAAMHTLNPYNKDDIEDWLEEHNRLYFTNGIFWGPLLSLVDSENHIYKHNCNEFTVFLQGEEITYCYRFGEEFISMLNGKISN